MSFGTETSNYLGLINNYLKNSLSKIENNVSKQFRPLIKAIAYTLDCSGKRLRPTLCLSSAKYLGIDPKSVLPAAAALEFIHSYSLIHDDLPAMDDDDFRRGKPSSHKTFGEDVAILAGDALCTEAFGQLISLREYFPADNVLDAIALLNHHAGIAGMVGGQFLDVTLEQEAINLPELEFIHIHKTGGLILASTLLPGLLMGVDQNKLKNLRLYGEAVGLAFQISDDLLDSESGDRYSRGPRKKPKPSYTQIMTPAEAKERLKDLLSTAINSVSAENSEKAKPLIEIATFIKDRKI